MSKKKLKLNDLKVQSFTTSVESQGGGPQGPGTVLCSYGLCSLHTYCLIIGTDAMHQCVEDCNY